MRAERLLSMMLILQTGKRMTADDLAHELNVTKRTIYRDIDALCLAGIPIYTQSGNQGGIFLDENYRTSLNGLTRMEIQTLFVQPSQVLADLGLERAGDDALLKLWASLPTMLRRDADDVRQRIYIDSAGWQKQGEDISCLPTLQSAIWEERQVRLVYIRGDKTSVERVVHPLGLVAKGSVWYMVGHIDGEYRTYRVSRVQEAQMTPMPCERPPGFDLADYWSQSMRDFVANLPQFHATVRVAPEIINKLGYNVRYAKVEHLHEPDANGWSHADMVFDTINEAVEYILGFGANIQVIAPDELRERVITMAQAIVELYSS